MKYYKTIEAGTLEMPEEDSHDLSYAREMQEQYGLYHLSLPTIIRVWKSYSELSAASWLIVRGK